MSVQADRPSVQVPPPTSLVPQMSCSTISPRKPTGSGRSLQSRGRLQRTSLLQLAITMRH